MRFENDVSGDFNLKLQSQEKLMLADFLINQFSDAAFCLNVNAQFIYVNDATCRMTGYSREQLLCMKLGDIEETCTTKVWSQRWMQIQQRAFSLKTSYQTKLGVKISVLTTLNYVKYQDNEFACCYVQQQEVAYSQNSKSQPNQEQSLSAQYKNKEAELQTSLAVLRSTLESAPNGIMAVNYEGEMLYYNRRFVEMWQLPESLIMNRRCPRCKAFYESQVKDADTFRRLVWEVSSQSDFESYDVIELKDGRVFAHYSRPQKVDNKIIGRVWSVWDISQSKRTEEAIRLNEVRFRTLAETTESLIFLIQGNRICYVNPAAEKLTGYSKEEITFNFDVRQLIKNKKVRKLDSNADNTCQEYQEIQILTKSGIERHLACTVKEIKNALDFKSEESVELITGIEITDYKLAESELRQALEQAKQLSELRARFVSMVCHQFRTPLNVVSFSNSLLRQNGNKLSGEKKLTLIDRIQSSVEQISSLLDEILLLGKADAAKLEFKPAFIDLVGFCYDIIAKLEMTSSKHNINYVHAEEQILAYLDKKLLELILTNLLDNAIKYSPNGGEVNFQISHQENAYLFKIKDVGIGIPENELKLIFDPFYRGINVKKMPGTGLGLSIVKTLVDLHNGEILVDSKLGVGTTFTVILPSVQ